LFVTCNVDRILFGLIIQNTSSEKVIAEASDYVIFFIMLLLQFLFS